MNYVLAFALGYLLGSIPFGLIITRAAGGPDVRTIGSGNIGATNVLRTGRKGLAAATLLADTLKGTAAVVAAHYFFGGDAVLVAGFAAFIGHVFPIWLGFKGGKGVATFIGVLIGLSWPSALIFGAIWLAMAFLARYSSLAGLVASALTPLDLWLIGQSRAAALFVILAAILWARHAANIRRLIDGSEPKIGKSGATTA